jgi:hypothetical protein
MTSIPKTVQVFLPDGNARSVRIAEITSRTIQVVQVPRGKLKAAKDRDEVGRVGVYFLFGETEDVGKPSAYIGEAENCYDRLMGHHRQKEFWDTAVVVTSKTLSFTKAHARYLEYDCIRKARKADRYKLQNDNTPSKPHIPEPMRAELQDNLGTIQTLLSVLGHPVLNPVTTSKTRRLLVCQGRGADAKGEYTEEGLVVFKGSTAAIDLSDSAGSTVRLRRERLREEGVLTMNGETLAFTEDHPFKSPSGAAGVVLGRNANGWTEWADEHGHTLDELERQ